jgi:hypothetical protein
MLADVMPLDAAACMIASLTVLISSPFTDGVVMSANDTLRPVVARLTIAAMVSARCFLARCFIVVILLVVPNIPHQATLGVPVLGCSQSSPDLPVFARVQSSFDYGV